MGLEISGTYFEYRKMAQIPGKSVKQFSIISPSLDPALTSGAVTEGLRLHPSLSSYRR